MENREIYRKAAWLSGLAAVLVVTGCASTPPVQPSDTLAGAPAVEDAAAAPQSSAASAPAAPVMVTRRYVVRRGDTLAGIASANGCSVADLRAWNKLGARSRLRVGQALRIVAKDAAPASSPGANGASVVSPSASTMSAAASDASGASNQPAAQTATDRQVVKQMKRHASGVALMWPARGDVVEPFKPGRNRGIQIAGRAGDPVRAAADGRVMYAGVGLNGYGSLIIVQHNADFLTAYAHNRKILVKTGDVVRQGEQIAEMGDLDNARVALLFEVRRDGKPVNPMPYLPSSSG